MNSRRLLAFVCLLAFAGFRSAQAGIEDLVISEIQPLNRSVIEDENGDYSDWVEIHNAGSTAVDIGGCYLTDDPLEMTKWRFPSTSIEAGGFLVVFCSDKDRRVSGSELHTNFRLFGGGEFLALVAPNGASDLWVFAPAYPAQIENFSYGVRMNAALERLVGLDSTVTARVPTSGDSATASSLAWALPGFNDAGWASGLNGVGYDTSADYLPLINVDINGDMRGTNTSAWIRMPFVVDDASALQSVLLRVKYDDGFIAYLNGRRVAAANAPASPAPWDAGATGDHPDPESLVYQGWTISNDSILVDGENVLAIHGLNNGTGSSDFLIVAELEGRGNGALNTSIVEYFDIPTPGSGNAPGYPGVSPKPFFTDGSRVFQGSLSVEIQTSPPGVEIRYTTNGTQPTQTSTLYNGPFTISSSTIVHARTFSEGLSPSPLVTVTYLTVDASVASRSSNVPIVVVDTFGGGIPGTGSTTYGSAFMAIFDRGVDGRSSFSRPADIANRIGIRERGSSSAGRPKKSYRFEFWDERDEDKDFAPFGLPMESDWILYGAYNFDHTHMRNPFIYELSNQAGRYAARTRFVEVYLNTNGGPITSSDYWGVYSFMENLKRGNDRVDVQRLDRSATTEPEIHGGYIFKKDRSDPGGSGSFSAGGVSEIQWVYPDYQDTNATQRSWVQNHLATVFTTTSFMDVIDPLAAVDHHILNAMPKNVDAFRLSGYFFKPRNGPVEFGPIWDFDRSMNSTDGRDDAYNTWEGSGDSSGFFAYDSRTPYWSRWLQDSDFLQLWKDRWFDLRKGPMSTQNINAIIEGMRSELTEAAARDQARWNQTSNWGADVNLLKSWLGNRLSWIDSLWLRPPTLSLPAGPITPGVTLAIQGSGTIYYTTDGTDPRLPGGGISGGASVYSTSLVLDDNARVVARVRSSAANWSANEEATYYVTIPSIVITELMFHPPDPEVGSPYSADDFEFVEVMNVGDRAITLAGARLTGAVDYEFAADFASGGSSVLLPGDRVVVVSNLAAFQTRYDTSGMLVAGEYARNLGNAGDTVVFEGPLREPIHDFAYSDLWYLSTDGLGDSLTLVDPFASLDTWGSEESWAPSSILFGSPGASDSGLEVPGGRQLPGDSNQDGRLDISDSLSLLVRLFVGGGGSLPCEGGDPESGGNLTLLDVTGDSAVDISDAVYTLNFLFGGGPAPVLGTTCVKIEGCPDACSF